MKTQFDALATILTAGLSQQIDAQTDLSSADWDLLLPFFTDQQLKPAARAGLALCSEKGLPTPDAKTLFKFTSESVIRELGFVKVEKEIQDLASAWKAEGKCPLGIGGVAFSRCYPRPMLCGTDELVCIPLYKEKNADAEALRGTTIERGPLKVTVADSAAGPFSGNRSEHQNAVLRQAFFSAPCTLDTTLGLAYPNLLFRALYHVHTAQQQLMYSAMPFRMIVDWAMLLRFIASSEREKLDWAAFNESIADLGLTAFLRSFTALAVRLTGVTLPAEAAEYTASDDDVRYLYESVIDPQPAPAPGEEDGRFSRFIGVLRNSKKYSRFSDISPTKEAFRYLFS